MRFRRCLWNDFLRMLVVCRLRFFIDETRVDSGVPVAEDAAVPVDDLEDGDWFDEFAVVGKDGVCLPCRRRRRR